MSTQIKFLKNQLIFTANVKLQTNKKKLKIKFTVKDDKIGT